VEFVLGMPEVKIFNRSTESFGRMQLAIENMRDMGNQVCGFYAVQWARFLAVINMPLTLLGCVGAALYCAGSLSVPDMTIFLALGGISLLPMNRLMRFVGILTRVAQSWAEVHALLCLVEEKRGSRRCEEIASTDLAIRDLHVAYGEKAILKGISFTAKAATVTAIVGPSGSGKSTLTAVLAGMEKIDSGSISLGGIELEDFSNQELARAFSIVYQQPFIFSGTVRENILLGNEHSSLAELEQAVERTCCEGLIAELPHGYDTRIGAGGDVHLSGGQRQRIALARMALRNTPVVLLDEATAFADPESEAAIQKGLSGFLAGKTVLVVAHRLPSIAAADTILVLDDGRIAEQGRHEDLLKADGLYTRLWDAHSTARSWTLGADSETIERGAVTC
jgi:ATP-binding cassette subfamily B protein